MDIPHPEHHFHYKNCIFIIILTYYLGVVVKIKNVRKCLLFIQKVSRYKRYDGKDTTVTDDLQLFPQIQQVVKVVQLDKLGRQPHLFNDL